MTKNKLSIHDKAIFDAVLNTVSDGITVIGKDLKIIFQNKAIRKTYGSRIGEYCYAAYRGRNEP